jgi:hypothetical protein
MPVLQIIREPTGEVLALVPYSDRTPKAHAECYADARLLASARELESALALTLAFARIKWGNLDDDANKAFAIAEAALAKAEGRTP